MGPSWLRWGVYATGRCPELDHRGISAGGGLASQASLGQSTSRYSYTPPFPPHPRPHTPCALFILNLDLIPIPQGLHPLSLLRRGLPEAVADYLEQQVGAWLLPVAAAAALAAGLAAAAWQVRTWTAVQLALAGGGFGRAVSEAEAARAAAKGQAAAAAAAEAQEQGAAASEQGGAFSRWLPAALRPLFESDWKPTDR